MARAVFKRKSANVGGNVSFLNSLKNTSFGESRFYVFEYGLMLGLVLALITVLTVMFNTFFNVEQQSMVAGFLPGDTYSVLVSAFTVIFPLTIILIQRTAESETRDAAVKNLPWRKGLLGIFLTVVSLAAVISSVEFINSILAYLSIGFIAQTDFDWQSSIRYLFSAFILIITAWTFGNDYRHVAKDTFAHIRHQYRYGLVVTGLLIAVLFIAFPFRDSRNAMVDRMIVGDLAQIEDSVNTFVASSGYMPEALSDLDLSSEVKQRANAYMYVYDKTGDNAYQLCADFRGVSGSDDNKFMYLPIAQASPSDSQSWSHNAGHDCFSLGLKSSTQPVTASPAIMSPSGLEPDQSVQGVSTTNPTPEEAPVQEVTTEPYVGEQSIN